MRDFVNNLADTLGNDVGNVIFMEVVDSTHAVCTRLMEQMDAEEAGLEDTLVIARRQTSGLGRGDRRWESPAGGLYLSWICSGLSKSTTGLLPMLAAAAAHRALEDLGIEGVGIKWPNDIVVDGEKLAGLLIHVRHGDVIWATVGLGVNLDTMPELGPNALLPPTSVSRHVDRRAYEQVATDVIRGFVGSLSESLNNPQDALDGWRRWLIHRRGETLRVRVASGEFAVGVFDGLTPEGYLRLQQADGERIITSGDIIETH